MYFIRSLFVAILLFIVSFRKCLGQSDENPVVTIESGQIMGRKAYTVEENNEYYAFQGIPYAEPPLGNLRFRAPVKVSNWTGILNATTDGNICVQDSSPVQGQEDCLFVNVYTRNLTGTSSVMVWIYGGTFTAGDSAYESYGPDYLLDQGVVYVSFNYRVGVLGFLSTEDTVIPGNWGLKDQLLALQWVQNNIENFGGNASDVTIFGESAGAASVSYLLLSNRTSGLYNKAILQSGSSLCLWSLNRRARRIAFNIGLYLDIVTDNSSVLLNRLRQVDYETLQSTATTVSITITLENPLEGLFFSPVIEPAHVDAIVVGKSDELLQNGAFNKVPVLLGFNSNEAAAVGAISDIVLLYLGTYDVAVQNLSPYDLSTSSLRRLLAGICIKYHYFGLLPISTQSDEVIEFISDDQFNRPIRRMIQSLAQDVTVYFYQFSYEGNLAGITNRNFTGVGHAEDVAYLFRIVSLENVNITDTDKLVRSRMVKLWTNFAKYGNPTPTTDPLLENVVWEAVGTDPLDLDYLNINTTLTLQQNPFEESMELYDDIYETYGNPPHDTY
nr:carboxylesterase [Pharsalia antennata]